MTPAGVRRRAARTVRTSAALVLLTALAGATPACAETPPDMADYAFVQRPGAAVPSDLPFQEADGRPVRFGDLAAGKPVVMALGYFHCPSLCSVVRDDLLAALSRAGQRGGVDYQLAVVSIDPAETRDDAATALAADAARYPGSTAGWHFLTGSADSVAALARAVGFTSRFDIHLKQFLHPAGIVVLTPDGRVSGYVLGVGYQPGDVGAALVEAGAGGIAKAALPVLLLCFHRDAATGRYSLDVQKVLRLGAALTVLGIGGGVVVLWRKERRNKAA